MSCLDYTKPCRVVSEKNMTRLPNLIALARNINPINIFPFWPCTRHNIFVPKWVKTHFLMIPTWMEIWSIKFKLLALSATVEPYIGYVCVTIWTLIDTYLTSRIVDLISLNYFAVCINNQYTKLPSNSSFKTCYGIVVTSKAWDSTLSPHQA